jgi:hypothetical protein
MFSEIMSAIAGIRSALDIARVGREAREFDAVYCAITKVQDQLSGYQEQLIASRHEREILAERLLEATREANRLKGFEKERNRYRLEELSAGAFAYVFQPGADAPEADLQRQGQPIQTVHWLCCACFQQAERAILQFAGYESGFKLYACPRCKAAIRLREPMGEVLTTGRKSSRHGF